MFLCLRGRGVFEAAVMWDQDVSWCEQDEGDMTPRVMDCDGLKWSRPNYQDETHTVCLYNTSMICTHITTNFAEKKLCICTLFVWFHMVQVQGSNQMYAFLQKKKNVHVPSSMVYTSISDEIRVERCGQSLTDRCPQHLTARQD